MQSFKTGYKYLLTAVLIIAVLGGCAYYISQRVEVKADIQWKFELK